MAGCESQAYSHVDTFLCGTLGRQEIALAELQSEYRRTRGELVFDLIQKYYAVCVLVVFVLIRLTN
jgi:hypothetical protein